MNTPNKEHESCPRYRTLKFEGFPPTDTECESNKYLNPRTGLYVTDNKCLNCPYYHKLNAPDTTSKTAPQ